MEQPIYRGKVVGVTFEPTKTQFRACLAKFKELDESEVNPTFRLEADPENQYDQYAVKVLMSNKGDSEEFHIGWLPGPKGGFFNKKVLEVGIDKVKVELGKVNIFDEEIKGFEIVVSHK
jgi:hypothetical protein